MILYAYVFSQAIDELVTETVQLQIFLRDSPPRSTLLAKLYFFLPFGSWAPSLISLTKYPFFSGNGN
jgi:hypothetical protein